MKNNYLNILKVATGFLVIGDAPRFTLMEAKHLVAIACFVLAPVTSLPIGRQASSLAVCLRRNFTVV